MAASRKGIVAGTVGLIALAWIFSGSIRFRLYELRDHFCAMRAQMIDYTWQQGWDPALSPDGSALAISKSKWEEQGETTVDVIDTSSSAKIASFALPPSPNGLYSNDEWTFDRTDMQYCDSGRYLLTADWYSKVYVVDTTDFQPRLLFDANLPGRQLFERNRTVRFTCSADANTATVKTIGGSGIHRFDLDSGEEVEAKLDSDEAKQQNLRFTSQTIRGISADGRTLLTETTDSGIFPTARFRLSNADTGRLIVDSPPLAMPHHSCGFVVIGSCTPYDEAPRLLLSQSGDVVLAYWETGGKPLMRFSLR